MSQQQQHTPGRLTRSLSRAASLPDLPPTTPTPGRAAKAANIHCPSPSSEANKVYAPRPTPPKARRQRQPVESTLRAGPPNRTTASQTFGGSRELGEITEEAEVSAEGAEEEEEEAERRLGEEQERSQRETTRREEARNAALEQERLEQEASGPVRVDRVALEAQLTALRVVTEDEMAAARFEREERLRARVSDEEDEEEAITETDEPPEPVLPP